MAGTPAFVSYTGANSISITANAVTAPASTFTFILEDGDGDTVSADFTWLSFSGGATLSSPLSLNAAFDFSNVQGWNLISGGSGSSVNVTLTSATAVVPEPATMALLGLGGMTILFARRRRTA